MLPAIDRVKFTLEKHEAKCKHVKVEMYQSWQGGSRVWVTGVAVCQAVSC